MHARQIQIAGRLYMDILAVYKKAKFMTWQPSTRFTIKSVNKQSNTILKWHYKHNYQLRTSDIVLTTMSIYDLQCNNKLALLHNYNTTVWQSREIKTNGTMYTTPLNGKKLFKNCSGVKQKYASTWRTNRLLLSSELLFNENNTKLNQNFGQNILQYQITVIV